VRHHDRVLQRADRVEDDVGVTTRIGFGLTSREVDRDSAQPEGGGRALKGLPAPRTMSSAMQKYQCGQGQGTRTA
jgi:hypothetical protein